MIYEEEKPCTYIFLEITHIFVSVETSPELDWFQFETEMRKVVRDLMEPTI